MLTRFARWFSSAAGVWQTTIAVAVWVFLEDVHVIHDPSGFQLLYWLTVYSAITQPVLAYANRQDTQQGERILARLEAMERRELDILERRGEQ